MLEQGCRRILRSQPRTRWEAAAPHANVEEPGQVAGRTNLVLLSGLHGNAQIACDPSRGRFVSVKGADLLNRLDRDQIEVPFK